MINKPSGGTTVRSIISYLANHTYLSRLPLQTLQEVVACFCAVVLGQTQDYRQMIVVFKACYCACVSLALLYMDTDVLHASSARLSAQVTLMQDSQPPTRALPLLCSLAALFCEHGKFDQIRRDDLRKLFSLSAKGWGVLN